MGAWTGEGLAGLKTSTEIIWARDQELRGNVLDSHGYWVKERMVWGRHDGRPRFSKREHLTLR
jgi:hypothetical protein